MLQLKFNLIIFKINMESLVFIFILFFIIHRFSFQSAIVKITILIWYVHEAKRYKLKCGRMKHIMELLLLTCT